MVLFSPEHGRRLLARLLGEPWSEGAPARRSQCRSSPAPRIKGPMLTSRPPTLVRYESQLALPVMADIKVGQPPPERIDDGSCHCEQWCGPGGARTVPSLRGELSFTLWPRGDPMTGL